MKLLSIIFKNCLQTGTFYNNWKKSNVVPLHKKGDKQCCCKTIVQFCCCQYVIKFSKEFNSMLEFFEENNLCPHQSGFRSSDSCQSQLLFIVIMTSVLVNQSPTLEVRENFLHISKSFDKALAIQA